MDHQPDVSSFGDIADFMEASGDTLDGKRLSRLAADHYGTLEVFLIRLDAPEQQACLLGSDASTLEYRFPLAGSGVMTALDNRDFYTPMSAEAFPELFFRQQRFSHYLLAPLVAVDTIIGFLVLAYGEEPSVLGDAQYQALRILTACIRDRLQRQDEMRRLKMADKSTNRLMARVRGLLNRTPIMINGFDTQGRCILWNRECERVFGWTLEELEQHPYPLSLFYPDLEQRQAVASTFSASVGCEFREWRPVTRGGDQLVTLWANIMLPNGDMICIGHDITEQKQAEHQVRLAATVFESSYEGIMITDADNRISHINPAFTRITGYEKEEVIGLDPCLLGSGRHDAGFYGALWSSLADHDSWKGEVWNRRKSGEVYPQLLSISVVRDQRDNILHHVAVFTDITHLKNHAAELERLARYDALTNVPNRLMFSDLLERALVDARRKGTMLAVCYLDLDGFKPVNDRLGHAAGDQLLIVVSERLRHVIRSCDALARLGGDEFALLLTGLHDDQEYVGIVQRILKILGEPITIGSATIRVSASIGVTLFPRDDADAGILLRHADHAMYHAKKYGKNNYHVFCHGEDLIDLEHHHRLGPLSGP